MNRFTCSYWLDVGGPETAVRALHSALEREEIVPNILDGVPEANDDGEFSASYKLALDIGGSMEQWSDADDIFKRLSQEIPDAVIELQEVCEEPYTPTVYTTFKNGATECRYGRKLDPGELDFYTIDACAAFLRDHGCGKIADLMEKNLKD